MCEIEIKTLTFPIICVHLPENMKLSFNSDDSVLLFYKNIQTIK